MNDEVASIEQLLDSLHVVPLACEPQATTLVPNGMPIVSLEPGSPLSSIVTRKVALPSTAIGAGGSSTSRAGKELRFSILIHCFPFPGVLGSGEMIATKRRQKRREWRVGHKIKPNNRRPPAIYSNRWSLYYCIECLAFWTAPGEFRAATPYLLRTPVNERSFGSSPDV